MYYSQYRTVSQCESDEEREAMTLLRAIERRFQRDDFQSRRMFFDPRPWIQADDVDLDALRLPEGMLEPVLKTRR